MKKLAHILAFSALLTIACAPQDNNFGEVETKFCGCDEPLKDLKWLNNSLDPQGHIMAVWLLSYGNEDYIFLQRDDDNVIGHWFDCGGNETPDNLTVDKANKLLEQVELSNADWTRLN